MLQTSAMFSSASRSLVVLLCAVMTLTLVRSQPEGLQARFGLDILTVTSGESAFESFSRYGTYPLHETTIPGACPLCASLGERVVSGHQDDIHVPVYDFFARHIGVTEPPLSDVSSRGHVHYACAQQLQGRSIGVELPPPKV